MIACENLKDKQIIQILLDGGSDINAVNSDDKLPLTILKERLEKDPSNESLKELYTFVESKGGVLEWRQIKK
jgi:ankyrin repeat protein